MSTLRFNDGMSFDTSGEYRIIWRSDGLYVVGNGILMAVADREEGQEFIDDLTKIDNMTEEDV